ncbi:MAG TPA: alpha/beta hydrolase [Caulobacter sp.]|nr:alpha/beta hydrolase [Caulobacter sp.]
MADGHPVWPDHPPPLAPFNGDKPPAPAWFDAALAIEPERSFFTVEGAKIELLTWGEIGKPGVLLLHGNGAHADWWSFIAPLLAEDYRVAAISWSGMGDSDWRPAYDADLFAAEILGAIEAARLEADGNRARVVGHSFGGFPTLYCAVHHAERLGGIVMLDSTIHPPERQWNGPPRREGGNRVYADLPTALARFRLAPPQGCENPYIADWIARKSLRPAPLEDGPGMGWTWKFDPELWHNFTMPVLGELLHQVRCPVALVWGERSKLMFPETLEFMLRELPDDIVRFSIPDADHHVMIDQPLATAAALRALLASWPS